MMKAAKEGLIAGTPAGSAVPKLIAVTQLTSTSEEAMQTEQLGSSPAESVLHYADLTCKSGLDGVVCSAWEARMIKDHTNEDFICLTPASARPAVQWGTRSVSRHRAALEKSAQPSS